MNRAQQLGIAQTTPSLSAILEESHLDEMINVSEADKAGSGRTGQAGDESAHATQLTNKRGVDDMQPAIAAFVAANVNTSYAHR